MSRNGLALADAVNGAVTSREGRVSRNENTSDKLCTNIVTSREGRVSRNSRVRIILQPSICHVPRGACE